MFDPCVGKIPWRKKWQPTPVFWPGEIHGQRSLAGGPWGHKELDRTEQLSLSLDLHPRGASGQEPTCRRLKEMQVLSLNQEYALEEGMATHSSILAWRIPWTEEPGGLRSMGLQKLDTTEET